MTSAAWIEVVIAVAIVAVLIVATKLKILVALAVFGTGFWFATTPAGVYIIAETHRILASIH